MIDCSEVMSNSEIWMKVLIKLGKVTFHLQHAMRVILAQNSNISKHLMLNLLHTSTINISKTGIWWNASTLVSFFRLSCKIFLFPNICSKLLFQCGTVGAQDSQCHHSDKILSQDPVCVLSGCGNLQRIWQLTPSAIWVHCPMFALKTTFPRFSNLYLIDVRGNKCMKFVAVFYTFCWCIPF